MRNITRVGLSALLLSVAAAIGAQQPTITAAGSPSTAAGTDSAAKKKEDVSLYRPLEINHVRMADQRGREISHQRIAAVSALAR